LRSVMLPCGDNKISAAPSIILPGPGKAGTTSLYWYLSQHPDICRSSVKETVFFASASETEEAADGKLQPIADYQRYFERWSGERYLMEASPRYFQGGPRLVSTLTETLPDARVIVTLRDPVTRMWSMFRYAKSMLFISSSETFEQYIARCQELRREGGQQTNANRPYWNYSASHYAEFLPAWFSRVPKERLKVIFFEDMVTDTKSTLEGLCSWLGIDAAHVATWDLTPHNQTTPVRNDLLQRAALAANHEKLLRNHPRLKKPFRKLYYAVNRDRSRSQMREDTREELYEAFAEPNRILRGQLRANGYTEFPGWLAGPEA
jgi:hypothetical protein